jgi:hypothetical protein
MAFAFNRLSIGNKLPRSYFQQGMSNLAIPSSKEGSNPASLTTTMEKDAAILPSPFFA